MFDKLKPWYIRMNKIHDCYTFRYHFEFQLYYDTFVYFSKRNRQGELSPPAVRDFVSVTPCKRNLEDLFFSKIFLGWIRFPACTISWHSSIRISSSIHHNWIVIYHNYMEEIWVCYHECIVFFNCPIQEDRLAWGKNPILEFMEKFQNHIYKYIKHTHRSRWKYF